MRPKNASSNSRNFLYNGILWLKKESTHFFSKLQSGLVYGGHKGDVILSEAKDLVQPRLEYMRSLDKLGATLRVGCFAALNTTEACPIICLYKRRR
jgi:hypothetical protein